MDIDTAAFQDYRDNPPARWVRGAEGVGASSRELGYGAIRYRALNPAGCLPHPLRWHQVGTLGPLAWCIIRIVSLVAHAGAGTPSQHIAQRGVRLACCTYTLEPPPSAALCRRRRKTKIVCTIGPTSCTREGLFQLADAGMSVVRLNMSVSGLLLRSFVARFIRAWRFLWLEVWRLCAQFPTLLAFCVLQLQHGDHASHKVRASAQLPRTRGVVILCLSCPRHELSFRLSRCAAASPQAVVDLVREYNSLGRGNLAVSWR